MHSLGWKDSGEALAGFLSDGKDPHIYLGLRLNPIAWMPVKSICFFGIVNAWRQSTVSGLDNAHYVQERQKMHRDLLEPLGVARILRASRPRMSD